MPCDYEVGLRMKLGFFAAPSVRTPPNIQRSPSTHWDKTLLIFFRQSRQSRYRRFRQIDTLIVHHAKLGRNGVGREYREDGAQWPHRNHFYLRAFESTPIAQILYVMATAMLVTGP